MRPRILIVEDESGIADTLRYALTTEGFEPFWFGTGTQALDELDRIAPALVLLDIGLPDMNGLDVFKHLRERHAALPVVFLTARSDEIDRVVGLELGADDYVAKPFSPRELLARVRAVLRRAQPGTTEERLAAAGIAASTGSREVTVDGTRVIGRAHV